MIHPAARLGFGTMNTAGGGAGVIQIECANLKQTEFAITTKPEMPSIGLQARATGVSPDVSKLTIFSWTAKLEYNPTDCLNGIHTAGYEPLELSGSAIGGAFTVKFGELRGGRVTVRVTAKIAGTDYSGERKDLRIVGTNPTYKELGETLTSKVFKGLVWHESRGRQFLGTADGGTSGCPLYSGDKLGGVGLMQLTRPAPTKEQTWNWRENITAGQALFATKVQAARAYFTAYARGAEFTGLVTAYNAARTKKKQAAITVTMARFTEEQVQLDALRGYNGWSAGIHEFRAARDASGLLVVDIAADGKTGTARWEQVSAATRQTEATAAGLSGNRLGDTDYVHHVMNANVPF